MNKEDIKELAKNKIVKNHECCRAAKKYGEMVTEFFESEYNPFLRVVGKAQR